VLSGSARQKLITARAREAGTGYRQRPRNVSKSKLVKTLVKTSRGQGLSMVPLQKLSDHLKSPGTLEDWEHTKRH
jgi:hypothetical protein